MPVNFGIRYFLPPAITQAQPATLKAPETQPKSQRQHQLVLQLGGCSTHGRLFFTDEHLPSFVFWKVSILKRLYWPAIALEDIYELVKLEAQSCLESWLHDIQRPQKQAM